jgi:hypothetical protein
MAEREWFETFCSTIQVQNGETISARRKRIVRCLNSDFRNSQSDTAYSIYVGSYGRNTAKNGVSDLDLLYELPVEEYSRYNGYAGNGQSALLQRVKSSIAMTYPNSELRGDGQVVVIEFSDGSRFEVVPAFLCTDDSYRFPNANDGGSWKNTNPRPEIAAIRIRNNDCNGNLVPLCRMARAWRDACSVPIGGMLIDTLAYQFIERYEHRQQTIGFYDWMCRDFFLYLSELDREQEFWRAPGSGQWVYGKGLFQHKAKQAHNLALSAIENQVAKYESTAKSKWREIFGTEFPR